YTGMASSESFRQVETNFYDLNFRSSPATMSREYAQLVRPAQRTARCCRARRRPGPHQETGPPLGESGAEQLRAQPGDVPGGVDVVLGAAQPAVRAHHEGGPVHRVEGPAVEGLRPPDP